MNTIIDFTFSNCNIKTHDRLKYTPSPSSLSKKYDFVFAQGTRGPAASCCGPGGGGGGGQGGEADCSGDSDSVGDGDAVGDGDGVRDDDVDEDSYDGDEKEEKQPVVWNKSSLQND